MVPARIVIDIPQVKSADVHWLKRVVESYRRAGFGVAVEASGVLQAKMLCTLVRPDWVRLSAAAIVSEAVAQLHGLGVMVVATRVEDASTHAHCLSAGVDLVQGFFYDQPAEKF